MTKRPLAVVSGIALTILCTGCGKPEIEEDNRVAEYCSAILDVSVHGDTSDLLTDSCYQELKAAGNPGGSYDYKDIRVWSVNEDGVNVCLCEATYTFDSSSSVWDFVYRITFTTEKGKVTSAEVIDYATL